MNKDNTLDQAEITKFVKSSFNNEAWLSPLIDQIISKCIADSESVSPPKFNTEGLKPCKPSMITFKHCLDREIQLNCPANQIQDKESCERYRNHDQPMLMGPPEDD